ncbi:MAG: hypothetical protein J5959_09060 [Butyrivibrio sp.]|nr:hypothetical protein [Butyrivibrio sp.]
MSIVLAGDTHGTTDIWKVKDYFDQHEGFTKKDYQIILNLQHGTSAIFMRMWR